MTDPLIPWPSIFWPSISGPPISEPFVTTAYIWLTCAVLLDLLAGDPRTIPHPVRMIGFCVHHLVRRWNRGKARKWKGLLLLLTVSGGVYVVSTVLLLAAYRVHWSMALMLHIYLLYTTIAINGLHHAAMQVWKPLRSANTAQSRLMLGEIVGRDTEHLSSGEIVRGTVETVAENTVDGITAPLFWGVVGGAPLALVYRAVNTLDSMVGYRNETYEQFGWASARCDDFMNWIPARLTAMVMCVTGWFHRTLTASGGWRVMRRDARRHPSPNSGWPEAAMAGLLGVQLGGRNTYRGIRSERAKLGNPVHELEPGHIPLSLWVMHATWMIWVIISLLLVGWRPWSLNWLIWLR